jgi:hypothetical protein
MCIGVSVTCNAASRRPLLCLEPALVGGVEGCVLTTGLQDNVGQDRAK